MWSLSNRAFVVRALEHCEGPYGIGGDGLPENLQVNCVYFQQFKIQVSRQAHTRIQVWTRTDGPIFSGSTTYGSRTDPSIEREVEMAASRAGFVFLLKLGRLRNM